MNTVSNGPQIERAYGLIQSGRVAEAIEILKPLHLQEPSNHLAAHLLGMAQVMQGQVGAGLDLMRRSVELMPSNPQYAENYISSLIQTGHAEQALAASDSILAQVPQALSILRLKALAFGELNQLENAASCYDALIAKVGNSPELFNERGVIHARLGHSDHARADFEKSIALNGRFDQAHYNLGNLFFEAGQFQQALQATDKTLALNPNYAQAWNNRGVILLALYQLQSALEAFDRAVGLQAGFTEAHNNAGVVLREMKRHNEAIAAFDRALKLNPTYVDALINKAYALYEVGRIEEAIDCCKQIIAIDGDHAQARLAQLVFELPVIPQTVEESAGAVERFMKGVTALSQWASSNQLALSQAIGRAQPFYLAYRAQDLTAALSAYGDVAAAAMQTQPLAVLSASESTGRIKLLIVSGHFCRHAVWDIILKGVISQIDKTKFELILCHSSAKVDEETAFARKASDAFFDGPKTAAEWVRIIQDVKPHVIFYPELGMDPVSGQLAAMRLAPLQIASWGHPVTSGFPTVDLFLSGEAIEPEEADRHYRERLIRLPGCGVYLDHTAQDAEPFSEPRSSLEHVRYAICHQPFKFDPADDHLYVEIARGIGACEFWFVRPPNLSWALDALLARMQKTFQAAGLDPACFKVAPWMSPTQFAGFLDAMDVYLDCPSFSGFTTAWAAVQRCLPIVTLEGEFMRQRLAAGLLRQVEQPEGLVTTRGDYVSRAVEWGMSSRSHEPWKLKRNSLKSAATIAAHDLEAVRSFERVILLELGKG